MAVSDFFHNMLLKLPPETAHNIGKWAMKHRLSAPGKFETPESKIRLFDVDLPNPFGIAAGFDKYAELHDVVQDYGFGWIEGGSFTLHGGRGNDILRLFRLSDGGLLNRMGLNCVPSYIAAEKYIRARNKFSFAPSIAKTHDPSITGDRAIEDIADSYRFLGGFGIYVAINISCPNTKEGKTFEEPDSFKDLVNALKEIGKRRPIVFKFSPGLETRKLEKLVEISHDFADGYEAVNTLPYEHSLYGKRGLSGPGLDKISAETIVSLREMTDKPIIGVGGIRTGNHAFAMSVGGANVFLCYTGFVYKHKENPFAGVDFAHKINREYREIVEYVMNKLESRKTYPTFMSSS